MCRLKWNRKEDSFTCASEWIAFLCFVSLATIIMKMTTLQQKAFCVLQFESCKSVITVQHAFRRQFNHDPLNANNIRWWHNQFAMTGCLCGTTKSVWGECSAREKFWNKYWWLLSLTAGLVAMVQMTGIISSGLLDHRISSHAIFFLWGFVKDKVYVPPLPANLLELRDRIRGAVAADMLINVWEELAYRLDECHVTLNTYQLIM